ncbi:MAG: acyl carrier protein [Gammaproteobacteria bacterium]|jgi:acyl carrier protein
MKLLSGFTQALVRPSMTRLAVAVLLALAILVMLDFSVRFGFIARVPEQYLIRDAHDSNVHASYAAISARLLPEEITPIYVFGGSGMRESMVTDDEFTAMANEILDDQPYRAFLMPTVLRSLAHDMAALDLIRHRPGIIVYGVSFTRFSFGKQYYNQQLRGNGLFGRNETFVEYMHEHHARTLDRGLGNWFSRNTYLLPITRVIAEKSQTLFAPVQYFQHEHNAQGRPGKQERQLQRWLKEGLENYRPVNFDTNLELLSLMIDEAQKSGHRVFVVEQPMDYEYLAGRLDRTFDFYRPRLKTAVAKLGATYLDFERGLALDHAFFYDSQHLWSQQARVLFSRKILSEINAVDSRQTRESTMIDVSEIIDLIKNEVLMDDRTIEADTRLFSTGFMDSIQLTSLFLSLEQKYQVSIGLFDVSQEKFDTPAQVTDWVNNNRNA